MLGTISEVPFSGTHSGRDTAASIVVPWLAGDELRNHYTKNDAIRQKAIGPQCALMGYSLDQVE
jgi:hypothetical protein